MALLRPENFLKNNGLHLACKAGMCCEKASASPLERVFSVTDPTFPQRITAVIFMSSYPCISELSVVKK
jgi:hypothetical protein